MENKSDKTADKQDEPKKKVGKPFTKGVSGNPNGRPKGTRSMTVMLREALSAVAKGQDKPIHAIFIERMIHKALVEGESDMIKFIYNHLDGMPAQKIDHTSGGEPITGFIYEKPK